MSMNCIRKKGFVTLVFLMLITPAFLTNVKSNQVSNMDNRMLSDFPNLIEDDFTLEMENYLKDRVGLRTQLITLYQEVTNIVFHVLSHPSYMYGADNQIYTAWDLTNYQHLDTYNYPSVFGEYVQSMQRATELMGIDFYFVMPPSKETIYYEDYPKGYNVDSRPSRTECIRKILTTDDVSYIDLYDIFMKKRDDIILFNKKYDAGHYNADGMLLTCRSIYERIKLDYMLPEWNEQYYSRKMIIQKYLQNSYFIINDLIPHFETGFDICNDESELLEVIDTVPFCYRYINRENEGGLKLMVFGDSFSDVDGGVENYLWPYFSEITRIHNNNTEDYLFYLSAFKPDIVVYEVTERKMQQGIFEINHLMDKKFYTFNTSGWLHVNNDSICVLNQEKYIGVNREIYNIIKISCECVPENMAVFVNGEPYIAKKEEDGVFLLCINSDEIDMDDISYYQLYN